MNNAHIFALYHPNLHNYHEKDVLIIKDKQLRHRITNILRLKPQEPLILFDGTMVYHITIDEQTLAKKDYVFGSICDIQKPHTPSTPLFLMPSLLKKEAFEHVAYYAAQMGACSLQPILTQKTHRSWNAEKDHERLFNIMIAACEQAKSFTIPELRQPLKLEAIPYVQSESVGLYFEDTGQSLFEIATTLKNQKPSSISLFFGPEGGVTEQEECMLKGKGFISCSLTATILRAQEAVAVGLGSIASLIR